MILTDFDRLLSTTCCLFQYYANKQVPKFLRTPFLYNIFGRLLLNLVKYLFLEAFFFVSLNKPVLLHCKCLMSKFFKILLLVCRKTFSAFLSDFAWNFFNSCDFPLMEQFNIFSPHLVLCD